MGRPWWTLKSSEKLDRKRKAEDKEIQLIQERLWNKPQPIKGANP